MEDQGFGLPGDWERLLRERDAAREALEKNQKDFYGQYEKLHTVYMRMYKECKDLTVSLHKLSTAVADELMRINNPSAWDSFSQEGSDAIERIAIAAGLKCER